MADASDDRVGYRCPPKKNQFKSGQSGNPKGRPKGSRNLAKILEEEMDQKVSVTEDGKRKRVSKRRLAVRQQVNKAAQGDPKAFSALAKLQGAASGMPANADTQMTPQSEIPQELYQETLRLWFEETRNKGAQP